MKKISMTKIKSQKAFFIIACLFIWLSFSLIQAAYAATYYVSPTGNNATGDGSSENPWQTPAFAITVMYGGDELLLKDGTYRGISYQIKDPPSGAAQNYTVIKAENDFQAVLDTDWDAGSLIDITSRQYIRIEGLIIKNSTRAVDLNNCSYIKIRKCGVKNGTRFNERYGNVIAVGDDQSFSFSHHILFEDVFVIGNMRYGILIAKAYNCILRRCVFRSAGNSSSPQEPRSNLSFYGEANGYGGAHDNIVQNCIFIDSNEGLIDTGANNVHGAYNNKYYGSIWLKTRELYLAEGNDGAGGTGNEAHNCVMWDASGGANYGHAISVNSGRNILVNQCTMGRADSYGINCWDGGSNKIVKNSYFIDNLYHSGGLTLQTYNSYIGIDTFPSSEGNNNINPNLLYICMSTDQGTGEAGIRRGATIGKKRGIDDTLYGQTGCNDLTDDSLWPFPFEETIRALAIETDNINNTYSSNKETRGFAAEGTTLTKYIWEYLGNPMPFLYPPSDLEATSVENEIELSWADNSSIENGFKIERKAGLSGVYDQIAEVEPDSTLYNDVGLTPGATYYYKVKAFNDVFNSDYSNESYATPAMSGDGDGDGGSDPDPGTAGGSGGGGGGCFIATAAFGTKMAKEVRILSEFRDQVLLTNSWGRKFVKMYYTYSPPIADYIAQKESLKQIIRICLKPLISLSKVLCR